MTPEPDQGPGIVTPLSCTIVHYYILAQGTFGFKPALGLPSLPKGLLTRGYPLILFPVDFRRKQRKEIENLRELRAQLEAGRAVTNQALLRSLSLPLRDTNIAIRSRDVLDLREVIQWRKFLAWFLAQKTD